MLVICTKPTAADLPAIKKAEAAANASTNADSGSFSGTAASLETLKKLENLIIDAKPGKPITTVKKVEISCPVQLKDHVERFYENIHNIISGAEVGFECSAYPMEISIHEERTISAGKGKTVVIIATRTYYIIPTQSLSDMEMVLQLEHHIAAMAEKLGYKQPHNLESQPLQTFDIICDRLRELAAKLETWWMPLKKSKEISKGDIDHVLDACDLLRISLEEYDNLEEKILADKDELEHQLFQVELQKQELQQYLDNEKEIIRTGIVDGCREHQILTFNDSLQRVQNFISDSLRMLKSLNISPEVYKEMQEYFREQLEAFENQEIGT